MTARCALLPIQVIYYLGRLVLTIQSSKITIKICLNPVHEVGVFEYLRYSNTRLVVGGGRMDYRPFHEDKKYTLSRLWKLPRRINFRLTGILVCRASCWVPRSTRAGYGVEKYQALEVVMKVKSGDLSLSLNQSASAVVGPCQRGPDGNWRPRLDVPLTKATGFFGSFLFALRCLHHLHDEQPAESFSNERPSQNTRLSPDTVAFTKVPSLLRFHPSSIPHHPSTTNRASSY